MTLSHRYHTIFNELAQIQSEAEETMTDTVHVLRYAQNFDGHGGRYEIWIAEPAPMIARLALSPCPAQPVSEGGRMIDTLDDVRMSFPISVTLNVKDRIVLANTSETFEVQSVEDVGSWPVVNAVWCVKVKVPYMVQFSPDQVVGSPQRQMWGFSHPGSALVESGNARWTVAGRWICYYVLASCGTLADTDLIFDVKRNGTSIFTTSSNRPTIPAGQHSTKSAPPDVAIFEDGDYLQVDTVQVGVAQPGADLDVQLVVAQMV